MTKELKQTQGEKENIFKFYDVTPPKYKNSLCPTNLNEQKEQFFKHGAVPSFEFNSAEKVEKVVKQQKGQIHHHYFKEAVRILEITRDKYGTDDYFMDVAFGSPIDETTATTLLTKYLQLNRVEGAFKIVFAKDLSSSARMMWQGPSIKYNRPEARKYTMFIRNNEDNVYMRTKGIHCLANHEIGTHFYRMLNDGLQPWFSDRKKFGLRSLRSYELVQTEEGLATINTVLQANVQYLKVAALSYYTACMSETMTFQELFTHLGRYVMNPELRWRFVTRVKRGLADPSGTGGYGGDQCYFEGAVNILRNIDNIDFRLLYAGKLCVDELPRVKRIARQECIRCPRFLKNINKYKQQLRKMAILNKLIPQGKLERANTDISKFAHRTEDTPLSLRADSCMALYNPPSEHPVNSLPSIPSHDANYTKDPDSGFIYPSPSSSSLQSEDRSHSSVSLVSSNDGSTSTRHTHNKRRLLNRPKTDPVRVKKRVPKTIKKKKHLTK